MSLDEFAQQDDYPMLLVGVRTDELVYVLQFLQALEQTLSAHLIVAFHQRFETPEQWLNELVVAVRLQLEVLNRDRAEAAEPPAPPLPFDVEDGRCPPDRRLQALLQYLGSLLPNPDEYRVVVALTPLSCADVEAFARLMLTVVPHPQVPTWMEALRVVVWDDSEHALLGKTMVEWRAQHVLSYTEDFSTPALTDSLAKAAADPGLPLPERMASLMQLAALDFSHQRHADALDKYAVLHEYHFQRGEPDMQALSLLGAGDTLHAAGDSVTAKHRLQQGIAVAMEHKSLPALLNLLMSAAGVSFALGQFADAESYADSGVKVAAATLNPFASCDLLALRGEAQLAGDKLGDAMASYDHCRALCRTYAYFERWRAVLDSQIGIYAQASRTVQRRELEAELAELEQLEAGAGQGRATA